MKEGKQEQKRQNQLRVSPMKQFTAVVAALLMTAFMVLSMLAIGGSAYLSSHTSITMAHLPTILASLL